MALLPESCCSRDLASYCGEENARPGELLGDDPRTQTGKQSLVLKPTALAGRKVLLLAAASHIRMDTLLTSESTSRPKNMSDEMALAPANF